MRRRLRTLHRLNSPTLYYLAVLRQPPATVPAGCQYTCGYAIAYCQAQATVYDEAQMLALLAQARQLAQGRPT